MQNLYTALLAVQGELKAVTKDESSPAFGGYKYFDVNAVVAMLRPIITKHGLVVLQPLTEMNGKPAIETILLDKSGETLRSITPLIEHSDPQKWGGIITYTRRYALTSMFLIEGEEDDDAESAKQTATRKTDGVHASGNSNPEHPHPSSGTTILGSCGKCGAPNKLSAAGKAYCSKVCWKNEQPQGAPLPVIKVEERELKEWKPPVIDDGDVPLSEIPF